MEPIQFQRAASMPGSAFWNRRLPDEQIRYPLTFVRGRQIIPFFHASVMCVLEQFVQLCRHGRGCDVDMVICFANLESGNAALFVPMCLGMIQPFELDTHVLPLDQRGWRLMHSVRRNGQGGQVGIGYGVEPHQLPCTVGISFVVELHQEDIYRIVIVPVRNEIDDAPAMRGQRHQMALSFFDREQFPQLVQSLSHLVILEL
jgi:hypothetical protein